VNKKARGGGRRKSPGKATPTVQGDVLVAGSKSRVGLVVQPLTSNRESGDTSRDEKRLPTAAERNSSCQEKDI